MPFFNELKRRNVVRMAVLYVVAGWVLLQIADVLFDPLGLPEWSFRLVLGLLMLGFPFALVFAWIYEFTPEGLRRERDVDRSVSVEDQAGRKMNVAIVVLLVIAIAGLALDRMVPEPTTGSRDAAPRAESADRAASSQSGAETAAPANSIAVLPFVNMSGDPDNEYFSDGLSEELLNTLVRMGGLRVTGRTSSFAFKGRNINLLEIGQALNVAHVLEGSVRKSGDRVRITAQLVDTSEGYHLWSDTFDRELDDVFALQREIAEKVGEVLRGALLGDGALEDNSLRRVGIDPEAHEQYLRGMYIVRKEGDRKGPLEQARTNFEAALAIDRGYVDAHWGLFLVWDRMHQNANYPFEESLERMQHFAVELQRLAPGSDLALSAAARLAVLDYDLPQAAARLEEAMQRYPGDVTILSAYSYLLPFMNEYGRALEITQLAEQLDPLSIEIMRNKTFILYRMGDCMGVEEVMRRALGIEPEVGRFRYYLAMCLYETTGDAVQALPFAEAESLNWTHDTARAILYHALGDVAAAQDVVDSMLASYGVGASYQYAQIYAQWGDVGKAMEWLENAVEIRDPGIIQVGDDRLLSPLEGEPRFERVQEYVGHR